MISHDEKEELEMLRASAARFMTDPLERACFRLEGILERQHVGVIVRLIAEIVLLLKGRIVNDKR